MPEFRRQAPVPLPKASGHAMAGPPCPHPGVAHSVCPGPAEAHLSAFHLSSCSLAVFRSP